MSQLTHNYKENTMALKTYILDTDILTHNGFEVTTDGRILVDSTVIATPVEWSISDTLHTLAINLEDQFAKMTSRITVLESTIVCMGSKIDMISLDADIDHVIDVKLYHRLDNLDLSDEIEEAIGNYDLSDKIEDHFRDLDFSDSISDTVNEIIDDKIKAYDFSDIISMNVLSAINHDDEVEETLRDAISMIMNEPEGHAAFINKRIDTIEEGLNLHAEDIGNLEMIHEGVIAHQHVAVANQTCTNDTQDDNLSAAAKAIQDIRSGLDILAHEVFHC
jgi:hypothetical protein